MNKPNDIVQTFGNPIKCVCPIGQAKLIEKLSDHTPFPPETIKNYTKRKMVGAIANELLKYPHLFKETQSERPFDNTKLENWKVEYLDTPDHFYTCLIKKTNGESK